MLVITTAAILTMLLVMTYRRASSGQATQRNVQLRLDYREKEDAVLRSIVAITPNRAIRAMKGGSNLSDSVKNPLRWQNIFSEALDQANARTSIPSGLLAALNIANLKLGNTGDSALATPSALFKAITPTNGTQPETSDLVSVGNNRTLAGFPPALTTSAATNALDKIYPIISSKCSQVASADDKTYGSYANGLVNLSVTNYPNFNQSTYPNINFGYAKPGEFFVTKRNWWAFSFDVAAQDIGLTKLAHPGRDFVLSIYEVPSQLAISASSFMTFGQYASGEAWQNVTISGGLFASKAEVVGQTAIPALASRRSMTLSGTSTIGGQSFALNPFTPGTRDDFQMTHLTQGDFFPVSQASESGRIAFVPINRGEEFFDRFHPNVRNADTNTVSPTGWNNYSCGALQCAMRLDIIEVDATNKTPTKLRFSYLKNGVRVPDIIIPVTASAATAMGLPADYLQCCNENETYDFGTASVEVKYGKNGTYTPAQTVTGVVTFNNARFGDPLVGTVKSGYFKPSPVCAATTLVTSTKSCIGVYPKRLASYLALLHADDPELKVNNSLAVNVDYTSIGSTYPLQPHVNPCTDADYGVIVQECGDLTSYKNGFSLVTNLRTYIGEDFNITPMTPPSDFTPVAGEQYFPPCSIFSPEKRYGVVVNAYSVKMKGQIGSLAKVDKVNASDADPALIRPLDSKNMSGNALGSDQIFVNLRPIRHPAELPPIYMMNWLVVLEETRRNFVGY
jgi:hypothetical protein